MLLVSTIEPFADLSFDGPDRYVACIESLKTLCISGPPAERNGLIDRLTLIVNSDFTFVRLEFLCQ